MWALTGEVGDDDDVARPSGRSSLKGISRGSHTCRFDANNTLPSHTIDSLGYQVRKEILGT